jgi:predicted branched-subunit amino acid permease
VTSLEPSARLRAGLRAGVPFAIAAALLAISFGVVAQNAGMSQIAVVVMSAIVFAGSAQFTATRSWPAAAGSALRSAPPR